LKLLSVLNFDLIGFFKLEMLILFEIKEVRLWSPPDVLKCKDYLAVPD